MANIKDVAKLAGVSQSTVSIVLNGKSDARMISKATQKKVYDAVKRLDYHPNVAARRLRESGQVGKSVALFWANDFRAPMMVRFFRGLEEALEESGGEEIEITIHPYINDKLYKEEPFLISNKCNAIIVANASEKDLRFLDSIDPLVPLVLYNRPSAKYSTVSVDDEKIGKAAAVHLCKKGYKRPALLTAEYAFEGMKTRDTSFCDELEKRGRTL